MKVRKIICLLVFVFFLFLVPSAVNAYDYNGVTYNDNDFYKLQTFLNQPSAVEGKTNGQQLNAAYDANDPTTWTGVTWGNGRVTKVDFSYKNYISGELNLSDFTELSIINCYSNSIDSIDLNNDIKLKSLNCQNNNIKEIRGINQTTSITTTGCGYFNLNTSTYPKAYVNAYTSSYSKFLNWTIDGTIVSTSKEYAMNSDISGNLSANFSNPYYSVYFNCNGGSIIESRMVEQGSKTAKPEAPTKTNYIFDGWYKDADLTTLWDFESDTITQNTILYAKWKGIDCTVNFVHNDGTGNITSVTAKYGALITPPSNLPQREDCIIGGWFTISDTGTYWNFNINKVITTDVTLYAGWYDKNDFNKIKTFLSMPSAQEGKTNAQCFNLNSNYFSIEIPATWPGVIWSATPIKKVQSINWSDKAFWGILDLSNMSTLSSVSIINCSISGINVDGVSGLKSLICSNDNLSEINFGTNLSLETLDCSHNLITSLDLSQNISLKELNCTGNRLSTLNVSSNKALSILNCSANLLTSLNLAQNTVLTSLTCTWNKLTALDVSYNKNLTYLNCSYNYLIDINTSQNNYLNYIDCSSNNINSIDVSGTVLLDTLHCEHNNLTSLNFSYNIYLKYLYCWDNNISSLDLSNNRQLLELYCGDNLITSLNLTTNTLLAKLSCYSNSLTSLNISQNVNLVYIECYLNQLTKLDVTNNIKLISIVCYDNNLTSLNLSQNTALVGLYCQSNKITSLDLSHNTVLRYLKCYSNKLESLNLLHCAKLDEINCSKNLLTQLDVSRIELLDDLYCNDNQLSSLKINEYLRKLYCNNNKLATLDLSTNRGYLHELDCTNNQLKTLDFLGFNWNHLKCSGNQFKNITAPIGSLYNIINIISKSNGYVSIEYKNSQLSLIAEPYPDTSLVNWTVENNIISDSNTYINTSFLNGETITANFSKASVTFNSLGGSEVDVITTECASAITAPAAPVKSGYAFAGWYKEHEYINEWNFETDVVTENTTLYAKWNNNENICTVIFDTNGGGVIYDIGVETGATLTRPAELVRDGFVFCGWYKEETFDNLWDFENDKVTTTTTLYASWCPIGYKEYDYFKIQRIFNRPSSTQGMTIGECLNYSYYYISGKYNIEDPSTWDSVTWQIINNKKYVKKIHWGYHLNGDIDLSNLSALTELNIYNSNINVLDLSNNTALTYIMCNNNNITSLNLNNDSALTYLDCSDNLLTSINLSNFPLLQTFECIENNITTLDLSNNKKLSKIDCSWNKLILIKISNNNKIQDFISNGNGYLYINTDSYPECSVNIWEYAGSNFNSWTYANGAQISTYRSYIITSNSNENIYANFYQTITFYNGTGGVYASAKLPYNSKVTLPNEPIRTGYKFAGWYKESECINPFDFNMETVTQNINLYAKWSINNYTVIFKNGETILNSITVDYNTKLNEPEQPTKEGSTFAGWYYSELNKIWDFNLNAVSKNVTLYAIWESNYIVIFNSQGGSAIDIVSAPASSLLIEPSQPTRENNTFLGWYKESQCINEWNFDTNIVSNSMTLYAKWNTNKVTFESNGGSAADSVWVPFGEAVTQPNIEKTGYTLAGWYKESNFVNKWNFTNNKVTFDTTLYAKWNINNYTVSFDSKGGNTINNLIANYDSTLSAPTIPSKTGYTFAGWYKDDEFTSAWNFANDTVLENITLYAKWNINSYKVTFSSNGSSTGTLIINYNSKITEPITPKRSSYTFFGWYKESSLINQWNFNEDLMPANNIILYAKWIYNSEQITALPNYISFGTVTGAGKYAPNASATLIATPSDGYYFVHWLEGTNVVSTDSTYTFTVTNERALTAVFTKVQIPILTSVQSAGYNSIKLSWNGVEGATGYDIYRSTSSSGTYSKIGTSSVISYTDTALTAGKYYYYKIKAAYTSGSQTTYSSFSAVKYAKPIPATPVITSIASTGYDRIKLGWNAVEGATGYRIYRATSSSGTYAYLGVTTSTSYTSKGLISGKYYYYKVLAYTTANGVTTYSAYSSVKYAKVIPSIPTASAASYNYNSIRVGWSAVSGASGYELYKAASETGSYTLLKATTSSYYIHTSLSTGSNYYYKVRAYRLVGRTKVYGAFSSVTSAMPVPSAPTPAAVSAGYTSNKISWAAVSGASGYELYKTDVNGEIQSQLDIAPETAISYTHEGLTTNTPYYYKVKAYRTVNGNKVYGPYSKIVTAIPVPSAPTVKVTLNSYNSLNITWNEIDGADKYEISRSTSSASGYAPIYTTDTLSYTDAGLATGKTYYYKVRALVEDTPIVYGDYSKVTSLKVIPTTPVIKVSVYTYTSLKISWNEVEGATGYRVYRATSSSGTYTYLGATTSTSYTSTGLATGKYYYYKVLAYTTANGVTTYSAYSSVKYAKVTPSTPTASAESYSSNSIKISWGAVSGATMYELYWAASESGNYTFLKSTTAAYFIHKQLSEGSVYYYKVRAYHLEGSTKVYSSYSQVVYATPAP